MLALVLSPGPPRTKAGFFNTIGRMLPFTIPPDGCRSNGSNVSEILRVHPTALAEESPCFLPLCGYDHANR